jgi:UDP-glucose 4-epimerase
MNDMNTNILGTLNMLEAARHNNVSRFIFASSGAPLGEVDPPIHEKIAPRPVSPYGASKLAGEAYCSAYYRSFYLKTVSLRFGNVYGPFSSNKESIIAKFIKQSLKGEPCEIYGDGMQTRDFIYVTDLVDAIMKAVNFSEHPAQKNHTPMFSPTPWGETFQIATNKEHTVNEVAGKIMELLKLGSGKEMSIVYGKSRIGDVKRNYADTSKAKSVLGWKHSVELDAGLEKVITWFLDH